MRARDIGRAAIGPASDQVCLLVLLRAAKQYEMNPLRAIAPTRGKHSKPLLPEERRNAPPTKLLSARSRIVILALPLAHYIRDRWRPAELIVVSGRSPLPQLRGRRPPIQCLVSRDDQLWLNNFERRKSALEWLCLQPPASLPGAYAAATHDVRFTSTPAVATFVALDPGRADEAHCRALSKY
jgi:hypothetical protein